ncbi:MAG: GtrA family protein [Candidatus Caldarchaeum sp.]
MGMLRNLLNLFEPVRFFKFAVVGGVGLLINTAMLYLLTTYVFGEKLYMVSAVFAMEAAIINNFMLNEYWTFRDRAGKSGFLKRMLKFHGSRLLGAATSLLTLYLLTDFAGLYYLVSNLIAVVVGTVVNYLTSRFWVW